MSTPSLRPRTGSSSGDLACCHRFATVRVEISPHRLWTLPEPVTADLPSSYPDTLTYMSTERVTVSLPDEMLRAAQAVAEQRGVPFSAVVAEALAGWLRGRLVDAWLAEHQAEHGPFDEAELQTLAAEVGVPYLGPGRADDRAA